MLGKAWRRSTMPPLHRRHLIGKRPGGITFNRMVLPRREKQRKYKVARHQGLNPKLRFCLQPHPSFTCDPRFFQNP
jgi:hypothetical protein